MNRAFTLIEILVTVGIILIIASVGLIGGSSVVNNLRFSNAFNKMMLIVQNARARSLTTQASATQSNIVQYSVEFLPASGSVRFFSESGTARLGEFNTGQPSAEDDLLMEPAFDVATAVPGAALVLENLNPATPPVCAQNIVISFAKGTRNLTMRCDGAAQIYHVRLGLQTGAGLTLKKKTFTLHQASGIGQLE